MPQSKNYLNDIEHVVVVMFENRSFDNLLAWLYDNPSDPSIKFIPCDRNEPYDGLVGKKFTNKFPDSFHDDNAYPVQKGTTPYQGEDADSAYTVPDPDPHENFQYVYQQLLGPNTAVPKKGSTVTYDNKKISMTGFLGDYASAVGYDGTAKTKDKKNKALKILETYTKDQAPVINTLAEWYAVSDEWFSSIPTQTNANRAFAGLGTSQGLVNNHWKYSHLGIPVAWDIDTIWNVMMSKGKLGQDDWRIYYSELWFGYWGHRYCFTVDMFTKLYDVTYDSNMVTMDQFHQDAQSGNLPAFSFLEPMWYLAGESDGPPSSYHPPSDISNAETYLKQVFESLTGTPEALAKWPNTLLVVTFDEHGGCYDHVSPPAAVPPGAMGPPPVGPDYSFDFKTLGVRVPTILISPRIEKNTVFRSPLSGTPHYDHCSLIATLLKWRGIEPAEAGMGARVAAAPTFEDVLTLSREQARTDLPNFGDVRPPRFTPQHEVDLDAKIRWTDEFRGQMGQVLHFLSDRRVTGEELVREVRIVTSAVTKRELVNALKSFTERHPGRGQGFVKKALEDF